MTSKAFELSNGALSLLLCLVWGMRLCYRCCRRCLTARSMGDNTNPKEEIEMGVRPGSMLPPPPPSAPPRQAVATMQTERTPPSWVAPRPTARSGQPPPARGGGRYYLRPAKRARTE